MTNDNLKIESEAETGREASAVERIVSLEGYLRNEAGELLEDDFIQPIISYQEDINPDAINGDDWLENRTSFIWKVGVLSVADGNKRDWAYLLIGHQRSPHHGFELIGRLRWDGGENDDIARCLKRAMKCAERADILYED